MFLEGLKGYVFACCQSQTDANHKMRKKHDKNQWFWRKAHCGTKWRVRNATNKALMRVPKSKVVEAKTTRMSGSKIEHLGTRVSFSMNFHLSGQIDVFGVFSYGLEPCEIQQNQSSISELAFNQAAAQQDQLIEYPRKGRFEKEGWFSSWAKNHPLGSHKKKTWLPSKQSLSSPKKTLKSSKILGSTAQADEEKLRKDVTLKAESQARRIFWAC